MKVKARLIMICKICGQDVKNKGITSHLRKHKMSKKNKLNYIVLWSKNEVQQFIQNFTNYTT